MRVGIYMVGDSININRHLGCNREISTPQPSNKFTNSIEKIYAPGYKLNLRYQSMFPGFDVVFGCG
jgi:hypothetical protein